MQTPSEKRSSPSVCFDQISHLESWHLEGWQNRALAMIRLNSTASKSHLVRSLFFSVRHSPNFFVRRNERKPHKLVLFPFTLGLPPHPSVLLAMSTLPVIRVGGVPEHFNLPWHLAQEGGLFAKHGVSVQWVEQKEGTGQMIKSVRKKVIWWMTSR